MKYILTFAYVILELSSSKQRVRFVTKFKILHKQIELQFGKLIKQFYLDGGGVYVSHAFLDFMHEKEMEH